MVENLFKLGCLMFACFIAFAYLLVAVERDTVATRQPTPIYATPVQTSTVTEKKRSCGCCTERTAKLREKMEQARKHRQAKKQIANSETR